MRTGCIAGVIIVLFIAATSACSPRHPRETRAFAIAEVARWDLLGIGDVTLLEGKGTLRLTEGEGSRGVVLLCPEDFPPDVTFRFRVRPERHEGVNVVLLSVSSVDGGDLRIPSDYDGDFAFWNGAEARAKSYTFGFHTGFHQPEAFVRRNPGAVALAEAPDVATDEAWYSVEVSRRGDLVRLGVDGRVVLEAVDSAPSLPGGRIALRLRGPGDGSYSSLFRDLSVEHAR
jgi:hypothetical protein